VLVVKPPDGGRDHKSRTAKRLGSAKSAPASANGVVKIEPEATAGASMSASDRSGVAARLAELATLDLPDLRREWRQLFRREPPRLSRDQMMRVVAYRIQENAFGGLPQSVERRLAKLAGEFESDGRIAPLPMPKLKSGARLVREWRGRTHFVCVLDDGFEYEGRTFPSLTAVAFEITGAHWSGPRFFGLVRRTGAKAAATPIPKRKPRVEASSSAQPPLKSREERKQPMSDRSSALETVPPDIATGAAQSASRRVGVRRTQAQEPGQIAAGTKRARSEAGSERSPRERIR
jgi:Protein of unknown function (DUF2924)